MNDTKELFKGKFGQMEQTCNDSIPRFDVFSLDNFTHVPLGYSNLLSKLVLANFLGAQVFLEYLGTNLNFQRQYPLSVKIINFLLYLMVNIIILIFLALKAVIYTSHLRGKLTGKTRQCRYTILYVNNKYYQVLINLFLYSNNVLFKKKN